jgi:hypothetical protein
LICKTARNDYLNYWRRLRFSGPGSARALFLKSIATLAAAGLLRYANIQN